MVRYLGLLQQLIAAGRPVKLADRGTRALRREALLRQLDENDLRVIARAVDLGCQCFSSRAGLKGSIGARPPLRARLTCQGLRRPPTSSEMRMSSVDGSLTVADHSTDLRFV